MYVFRLQDLTDRDLAKHEREKTLNSLEAFIFETQVSNKSWIFVCKFRKLRLSLDVRCKKTIQPVKSERRQQEENMHLTKSLRTSSSPSRTRCTRMSTCWWCRRRTRNRSPPSCARRLSGWTRTATLLPPSSWERGCLSWGACVRTCSSGWRRGASGPTAWPP